jgi:dCMP deaminase
MIPNDRISWDEYALRIAEVASLRSEDPYVQVGACVLDINNRVIGVGYNGLAPSKNADSNFWENRDERRKYMIHAECNALSMVKRGEAILLACNLMPCSSCATLIASHGIKKVVYRTPYLKDTQAFEIFDFYNIEYKKL